MISREKAEAQYRNLLYHMAARDLLALGFNVERNSHYVYDYCVLEVLAERGAYRLYNRKPEYED